MIIKFFKKLIFIIFEILFIYIFLVFFSLLTFIIGDFLLRAIWFFYNKKRYLLSLNVFHQLFIDTFMRDYSFFLSISENIKILLLIIFFFISIYIFLTK